jgi:hypothetical protein
LLNRIARCQQQLVAGCHRSPPYCERFSLLQEQPSGGGEGLIRTTHLHMHVKFFKILS